MEIKRGNGRQVDPKSLKVELPEDFALEEHGGDDAIHLFCGEEWVATFIPPSNATPKRILREAKRYLKRHPPR